MVQLSITKEREAQLGSDLKCLFRPNANLLSSSLLRAKGSMFQILALLNLKEPWYLWHVLYEWKSRDWLKSLSKYA